jgi:very-short-patch-repair endonuclease
MEEIKQRFKNKGLTLVNDQEYINTKGKLVCYDDLGFYYYLSSGEILDKRTKSFDIANKYNIFSIKNIQKYINLQKSQTVVLSNFYVNEKEPIKLQCTCGTIYYKDWNSLDTAKHLVCDKCMIKSRAKNNKIPINKIKEICETNHYTLIEEHYVDAHNIAIMDKDGYKYKTSIYNFSTTSKNITRFNFKNPYTISNLCNYIKLNKLPIRLVDKQERKIHIRTEKLEFYCIQCGEVFQSTWDEVIREQRYRCKKCTKSKSNLEYIVEQYIIDKKIKYTTQKTFNDCKKKRLLPFDFYLDDYNTIIEVHGSQHYYVNKQFNQPLEEGQSVDKFKKDYCLDNDIKYVEIPFWYIKNGEEKYKYKEIINNILNQN